MTVVIPTLETERLWLRPFKDADHDAVADFFTNDPGARYVGGPTDRRGAWRVIATFIGHWHLRGFGPFAIEDKATAQWLGWCNLWRPPEFPEIEIGWTLAERHRGKGYVHEAAVRVRAYALDTLKLPTLVSYIVPENTTSRRVAERLGAKHETSIDMRKVLVDVWRHPRTGGTA